MCELSHLRWGAYSAAVAAQTIEVRQIFHHRKSGVWPVSYGSRERSGQSEQPNAHRECDSLLVIIKIKNYHIEFLIKLDNLFGVIYPSP